MDASDHHRSLSDHNSNAQVEPKRKSAIGMEDDNQGELTRSTGLMSGENGVPVEGVEIKKNDSPVLYEYEPYDSYDDSSDSIVECGNGEDGRRSCCSLSDETSSMSETELSVQGDTDNPHVVNSSSITPEICERESTEPGDAVLSEHVPSESEQHGGEQNDSSADDTFTDLTMDSLSLSMMENCNEEEQCSILPEISTLEITGSDFSFDWGDPANPETNTTFAEAGKQTTSPKKQADRELYDADGNNNYDSKHEPERKDGTIEPPVDHAGKGETSDTQSGKHVTEYSAGPSQNDSNATDTHMLDGQPPDIEGLHNFYSFPLQQPVMFYPPSQNQAQQPFPVPFLQTMGHDPQAYNCVQNQNAQVQQQNMMYAQQQQQQHMQQTQHYVPPQQMYQQCCPQYGAPAANFGQYWPNQAPIYQNPVSQPGMPFNTDGLLTAEQYYAGQETPEQNWSAPHPYSDEGICNQFQFELQPEAPNQDAQHFQYPCVYVSQAGLITVLLKHDVSVEFTVDKTLRLVSHQRRLVVATNSRGSANCLYHPHAQVFHEGTTTEVALSDDRKVRMSTEDILIAKGEKCYRFDYKDVQDATPDFRDISKDSSVTLLFGSSGYGPELVPQCLELAQNAQYTHNNDGSFRVRINEISISQNSRGDVTVLCGPKFLKMAPLSCYLRLQTHFIDMAVYQNSKIFVRRGTHSLDSNPSSLHVSNGYLGVAFEDGEDLSVSNLPPCPQNNGISQRQKKKSSGASQKKSKYTWRAQ